MPVDVTTRIVIDRPRDVVATFASDPSNAPQWYVNIKSVEWKTDPPVRVGSEVAFVAHFLGRRMAYTYKVVEFAASRKMVMTTKEGPFPMETSYTWESLSVEQTEMILRNRGNPSGFSRILSLVMVPAMRSANQKDLARLKQLLESSG
jgi:Polyketide cyclase / dehydrase and lipid transport